MPQKRLSSSVSFLFKRRFLSIYMSFIITVGITLYLLLFNLAEVAFDIRIFLYGAFFVFFIIIAVGFWSMYVAISQASKSGLLIAFAINVNIIIQIIFNYAFIYRITGIKSSSEKVCSFLISDYVYFSFVAWTTLGYGDIIPSNDSRLIAASEAFIGYVFMAIFIGLVQKIMEKAPGNSNECPVNCESAYMKMDYR